MLAVEAFSKAILVLPLAWKNYVKPQRFRKGQVISGQDIFSGRKKVNFRLLIPSGVLCRLVYDVTL